MDAVPLEPLFPGSLQLSTKVLATAGGGTEYVTVAVPTGVGSVDWSLIESSIAAVSHVAPHHGRVNQLIRATDSMTAVHDALRVLDDDDCDSTNLNRLIGFGAYTKPDIVWSDASVQVKWALDTPPAGEFPSSASVISPSAASTTDAEASALWRTLHSYDSTSYTAPSCAYCQASLPEITPDAVAVLLVSDDDAASITAAVVALAQRFLGIRVTSRDPALAQDYREGMRRFIGGILAALRLAVVMVMVALSHWPQVPSFLLVMLGSIRHYGHRGEPDGHFLPARAVHLCRSKGVVCLMA